MDNMSNQIGIFDFLQSSARKIEMKEREIKVTLSKVKGRSPFD